MDTHSLIADIFRVLINETDIDIENKYKFCHDKIQKIANLRILRGEWDKDASGDYNKDVIT